MNEEKTYKVGSRKSQLAIAQTNEVIQKLRKTCPGKKFEIVEIVTVGDKILDKPLPKIGEKSLFTKELEESLINNGVDFVVHSLKDLPTLLPEGLTIGAVMEREDPRDALILSSRCEGENLKSLPESSVIGTSSLRRTAQLFRNYPHLQVQNIRGNLNTRWHKLEEDKTYSGIILAAAGIKRMKWEERIGEYLDPNEFLYAVGQGAIAIECRQNDDEVIGILETLNHGPTILRVICERSFLKKLGGGCSAPVAVHSDISGRTLSITGAVWSLNGKKTIRKSAEVDLDTSEPPRKQSNVERCHAGMTVRTVEINDLNAAEDLGRILAEDIINMGALDIVEEARQANEEVDITVKSNALENGDKR